MFDGAKLTKFNGVISDFDKENFDESFCLPVKRAIILYFYYYCMHLLLLSPPLSTCMLYAPWNTCALYQISMLKGQVNYLLVY